MVAGGTRAETGGDEVVEGLRSGLGGDGEPRRDGQSQVTDAKGYGQEA
jgi:hypothetical protein